MGTSTDDVDAPAPTDMNAEGLIDTGGFAALTGFCNRTINRYAATGYRNFPQPVIHRGNHKRWLRREAVQWCNDLGNDRTPDVESGRGVRHVD